MGKSLQDIEEERRQAFRSLDELDRQKKEINRLEFQTEDLYAESIFALKQLDYLPLGSRDTMNLYDVLSASERNQTLIFLDIDDARNKLKKQERQVEDRIDELGRDYRLTLENQTNRKERSYGN
ncbi:hypothetical protein [Streptococcus oricebi]|uniref:Uncharacterized protein n=1 Tax=Streptococcus oricebi TaxID=1547447 RepID=A0ABS5B5S0_9STRE|nr:hypothetical protein [Streptococcus oricebi]MBP2624051.1 hypothetical protein [Streptococcus oricebi]